MSLTLPPSASVASQTEGAKMCAPAAARNADALCEFLTRNAPSVGRVLEIASGTGQHVARFAATLPGLDWQPTEIDPVRRASIDAYVAEAGLANLHPAIALDAAQPGWSASHRNTDLIVVVNLLHLIPDAAAQTLISEASQALSLQGQIMLYGPFRRAGRLTSKGDQQFDTELRAADPAIGYKDDRQIIEWLHNAGLSDVTVGNMPANNLAFLARRP